MKTILPLLLLALASVCRAQTVEEAYQKPLKEVLQKAESRFGIKISCSERLMTGKTVTFADWRLRSDPEATLNLILGPHDLVFSKTGEGQYLVEAFQYHKRPVEEGRIHLEKLSALYPGIKEWESRKAGLRTCMLEQLKLSPFPVKNPLNPVYVNKREHTGYLAENVAIESLPGVFVSGTLYRPAKGKGPFPAVMVAQGHFEQQHFEEYCQVLSATLARMGAVVFSYDMFAKGEESLQFAFEDHRTTIAPTMQTINSTRVLDFLTTLPYVDPKKIAMTGASGGGTQTFLLTALDPRIAVSVPVVMVSSWFFGGCPCESGLPIHSCGEQGTNNVEIAAMAAPRPMLVVSDGGDWTANVPEIEFPYLKRIYSLYGNSERVENDHFPKEGHDYGPSKRKAVYNFLVRHLGLTLKNVLLPDGTVDESKSVVETKSAMLVFGEKGENLPAHAIHGLDALKKILDQFISTEPLGDSMRHWYGIADKGNIIQPKANQARYPETEIAKIADNMLLYQRENGGWPKNYDMQAILTDAQKDSLIATKGMTNTTFDNSTTYTHIEYLAKAFKLTGTEIYREACLKGISFVLKAQYPNGGWPQYFPLEEGDYSTHITFNDGAYLGVMKLLQKVADNHSDFTFIDPATRQQMVNAFQKGLDCMLKTQIRENGKLTAWCQQHDELTLQPAWARAYEPPSICNGESAGIVLFLMSISSPDQRIIESVTSAVRWFLDSRIYNTRVETITSPPERSQWKTFSLDRVVVVDSQAPPIWTRYYELKTHRPLFSDRNSKFLYALAEVSHERRAGYSWYTYDPQKVLQKYPDWQKKWTPGENLISSEIKKL